jgi:L-alanine-DL-glutamate epimerase-like enolase superfamily enzyme
MRENIARIISGVYGVGLGTYAGEYQDKSIYRAADLILASQSSRIEELEKAARLGREWMDALTKGYRKNYGQAEYDAALAAIDAALAITSADDNIGGSDA